ncbi:MAG: hypothetical protein IJY83_06290 [Oscillospiraceae bacterium]|nr:hypothetical protein [Oscillospiraceae bacterium]
MNNKKYSPSEIIISVIFVIWFIASIAVMIFFGKTGRAGLVPAVLGQYFLVFGIAAGVNEAKNKKFNPIALVFAIVGIAGIVATLILYFGAETMISFLDKNMPYILMTIFLIVGIILVIVAVSKYFGRKKRCSYMVTAKCIELREMANDGHMLACPVYEIYYDGRTIKLCDDVYSNNLDVRVGDEKEIMINPDKPTEYFAPEEMAASSIIIGGIGIAIVLVMIFALVMTGSK